MKILTAKTARDFTFVKVIAVMALLAAAVLVDFSGLLRVSGGVPAVYRRHTFER
jgi:hypothetical protein